MTHVKAAYYFSHYCNTRNDEKSLMLRAEHGWEGYGMFWALTEMMFESDETCLYHGKIKGLALSCNIDVTLLKKIIDTCIREKLFESDEEKFWSNTLREGKEKFLELREKRSMAGKKGAKAKWSNGNAMANARQTHSKALAKDGKGKERKGKEKKNSTSPAQPMVKYAEFVTMTKEEYGKLTKTYGEQATNAMIEILDNYKGANGKKYKSDYRAILSWVAKKYEEEKHKAKPKEGELLAPYHRKYELME